MATIVCVGSPAAAQADHFQWSGMVAPGETIEIQGGNGGVRGSGGEDDSIDVLVRGSGPASVHIEWWRMRRVSPFVPCIQLQRKAPAERVPTQGQAPRPRGRA